MIAIEPAQGFRGWALYPEQILAQSEAGGRLGQRAFVRSESGRIERAQGGEQLGIRLDTDATVIDQRALPLLGRGSARTQYQDQSSNGHRRGKRLNKISDKRTPQFLETRAGTREVPRALSTCYQQQLGTERATRLPIATRACAQTLMGDFGGVKAAQEPRL
jgi:hypothetical protein